MHDQPIHGRGLCECGCGQKTTVSPFNRAARGWVKGTPRRYVGGHCAKHVGPRFIEEDRGYESPCHIWQLYTLANGYGLEGKRLAHRAAWEREHGPIPAGMWICHRCDVPSCVNPAHLFLGTPSDNQYDCVTKGRRVMPRGEDARQAVLTWEAVRTIRASTESNLALAERYGVAPTTISSARTGRSWRHDPRSSNDHATHHAC